MRHKYFCCLELIFQEDFEEFSDVDDLYNSLPLDKVESLEDLVTIGAPGLVKVNLSGLSCVFWCLCFQWWKHGIHMALCIFIYWYVLIAWVFRRCSSQSLGGCACSRILSRKKGHSCGGCSAKGGLGTVKLDSGLSLGIISCGGDLQNLNLCICAG